MIKIIKPWFVVFVLSISASGVHAAAVFQIESARMTQLYSQTFDGLVFSTQVTDDGSFFGAVPFVNNPLFGVNRGVDVVTLSGQGGGSLVFDGNSLTSLQIVLPQTLFSFIDGLTTTTDAITNGFTVIANSLPESDGGNDPNFDVGSTFGNQSQTFPVLADASAFNLPGQPGVVTSCSSPSGNCALLPALSLDATRYTLAGTPTLAGGDDYIFRAQTSNGSYYEIEFTTAAVVPLPASFWLLCSGLIGLNILKRRGSFAAR